MESLSDPQKETKTQDTTDIKQKPRRSDLNTKDAIANQNTHRFTDPDSEIIQITIIQIEKEKKTEIEPKIERVLEKNLNL